MPEGTNVWQDDLLESRARSRGDVIFFGGGGAGEVGGALKAGDKMRINLASEKKEKGGGGGGGRVAGMGINLTITSHHAGMVGEVERGLQLRNFSGLWMSHRACDALIHVSDRAPVL